MVSSYGLRGQHRKYTGKRHRGAIILLAALLLVVMIGCLAFSLDVGYLTNVRTDMQRAVDAAALAGTGSIIDGPQVTAEVARSYVRKNMGARHPLDDSDIEVQMGYWDEQSLRFLDGVSPFTAVRVTANREEIPLFFGPVLSRERANVTASAVATYQPRDIMLVLDYSGSMNNEGKIDALKESVTLFLATLQQAKSDDRVGFVAYSTEAELERGLTKKLKDVGSDVLERDASGWTNIGHAMELARQELRERLRARALPMVVLMTDGKANRPEDRDPLEYIRMEASLASSAGIPVIAISFSNESDQAIMKHVADTTGGVHFHVAGTMSAQEEQLKEVFRQVAARRPIQLVQ